MIVFDKTSPDATTVRAKVDFHSAEQHTVMYFYWAAGNAVGASAIAEVLNTKLHEAIRTAREEAYGQGWAAAKSKRSKETTFSSWL